MAAGRRGVVAIKQRCRWQCGVAARIALETQSGVAGVMPYYAILLASDRPVRNDNSAEWIGVALNLILPGVSSNIKSRR